ncbi:MAG: putative membrane protein [uncultured Frankineae bacterium]|uniref:Putative membrane protein n=1 Tax=uncultured Frankineae bacterium TaxID=437475 RepID=A0A6J4LDN6_9ACTN|nr:MAG: putative membrane protein [uncultured Frankineae bacterium]
MALTGRAALLALLGVLPVLVVPSPWTVLAVAVLLALVATADALLAAPVGALGLTRSGATACRLGESVEVALTVTNPGPRELRGALRDAWVPSAGAAPRVQPLAVPAGQRRTLRTVLQPTRRGDRVPDRVTVRSVGPLGVAARQGRHEVPWRVRVQPPFTSRKHLPERLARLRQLDGAVVVRQRGQGTEFDTLRDYVEGDDVRAIDWRATARRQDLVVRTWRPERDRTLLLVLDTSRTSAGRVGDEPRLDVALDATLLLTALASRAGDRVDLLAFDREPRAAVEGASRSEVLARTVDAVAGLEPALVEGDGRRLVGEVLRRTRRRSLVVLFTSLDTAPLEEGLLPHLPSLTSRHTVLLAAVADPRVEAMAQGRGTAEAVYDAAAAERARTERRRLTARLRRAGVEVVDAPPEHFAPAVSDAYLSLKAAGRL